MFVGVFLLQIGEGDSDEEEHKVLQNKAFRKKRSLMKKVSEETTDLESSDGSDSLEEAPIEKVKTKLLPLLKLHSFKVFLLI